MEGVFIYFTDEALGVYPEQTGAKGGFGTT